MPVLAVSPVIPVLLVLPITPPVAGDGFCAVVAVAGSAAVLVALAALTVSGDVVIVLLWIRRNGRERLYAYVTVAYVTVG
jgi:hypothetical protein